MEFHVFNRLPIAAVQKRQNMRQTQITYVCGCVLASAALTTVHVYILFVEYFVPYIIIILLKLAAVVV